MTEFPDKSKSRGFSRDMTGAAIMRRLRIVNDLYQSGKLLQKVKYQGKVSDLERAANEVEVDRDSNPDPIRSGLESQATERRDP